MRRPMSLGLRLTVLFGLASAVVFPLFGVVIVQSTEQHFRDQDSDELKIIADAVQEVISSADLDAVSESLDQRLRDILVGHHDASLYIADQRGHAVYASSSPDLSSLSHEPTQNPGTASIRRWETDGHSYRVLDRSMSQSASAPLSVIVAVPIDHHQRFLADFQRKLWLMIAGSVALMSVMGWIAVRQGHAPLREIVDKIRQISADELDTRLSPESVPGELTELAESFNEMLARVDKAFHRLSEFNADMAHELRTPIANLMTQTQVALTRARALEEYREILYSNMEEYEQMAQTVGSMLFLAQVDIPQQRLDVAELDLAHEVAALVEYYEGWAEEHGVTLALAGQVSVSGNRMMLQRALGNLLSNAIRHTPRGGTIGVELSASTNNEAVIVVGNPGPTISPEHLPRLFDRFYRVDPSRQQRVKGVGLGLAIVASIVNAHGGKIDVISADDYTRFIIILPQRLSHSEASDQTAAAR